jgi:hypothetical protein
MTQLPVPLNHSIHNALFFLNRSQNMQPTAIDSKSKNHHGERVAFIRPAGTRISSTNPVKASSPK